jgi:chloramphenicol-sensitive protein RarD
LSQRALGMLYGVLAFGAWGLMPLYWRPLHGISAPEILCHRIVWSLVFVTAMLALRGRTSELLSALRDIKRLRLLILSAMLIAVNWGIFIWAVNANYVLESSLGYFINPLMNVALGTLVLKERLAPLKKVALGFASAGVLVLTIWIGVFPWIALSLATTFALYGLIRKLAPVDSLLGLSLESTLLAPLALAFLLRAEMVGSGAFLHHGVWTSLVLVGAGPVTALPLLWFAHSARRLELSTVGVLQYLAPTGQFLVAVFVNGEPFTMAHQLGFALIWIGLGIYTYASYPRPSHTL